MKKILLIGKTDSTYTELGEKLSAHYTVRYGSSGGFAAEALLRSFAPSLIVIRTSDSDREIIQHIGRNYPHIPVIVIGTSGEAAALSELKPAAVCADDVQTAYDTICSFLPYSGDSAETLTVMVIDDDAGILRMMKTYQLMKKRQSSSLPTLKEVL